MIRRVKLTKRARKQILKLPARIQRKLLTWSRMVEELGLEEVTKHDY
jgi:mRNA-degrading endonuclease RelE of RelBE toxin-antitoxin system